MTKAEIEKKKSLARSLFLSGMEQTEIAEKVDVSRVTISKWCTNTTQPSLDDLVAIARCLEVDTKDLLHSITE